MRLTEKDKIFLEKLKELTQTKELWVDLKKDGYKRLILKWNYGTDAIKICDTICRENIKDVISILIQVKLRFLNFLGIKLFKTYAVNEIIQSSIESENTV